jgi:hypothetical protein
VRVHLATGEALDNSTADKAAMEPVFRIVQLMAGRGARVLPRSRADSLTALQVAVP